MWGGKEKGELDVHPKTKSGISIHSSPSSISGKTKKKKHALASLRRLALSDRLCWRPLCDSHSLTALQLSGFARSVFPFLARAILPFLSSSPPN
jgi:hypothetical protein